MSEGQLPSKGRIVLFYETPDDLDPEVAVITRAHSPTSVNLRILYDGCQEVGSAKSVWFKPSIPDGYQAPVWDWPPRV